MPMPTWEAWRESWHAGLEQLAAASCRGSTLQLTSIPVKLCGWLAGGSPIRVAFHSADWQGLVRTGHAQPPPLPAHSTHSCTLVTTGEGPQASANSAQTGRPVPGGQNEECRKHVALAAPALAPSWPVPARPPFC